jgi:hypothetical protein
MLEIEYKTFAVLKKQQRLIPDLEDLSTVVKTKPSLFEKNSNDFAIPKFLD